MIISDDSREHEMCTLKFLRMWTVGKVVTIALYVMQDRISGDSLLEQGTLIVHSVATEMRSFLFTYWYFELIWNTCYLLNF